jgi:phage shock protein PspC (stress-responsive transcriptional regulator)
MNNPAKASFETTVHTHHWVRRDNGPGGGLFGGVCSAIAANLGVDVWIVRCCWIATVLFAGSGIFVYILIACALPRESETVVKPRISGVCVELARRTSTEVGLVRLIALFLLFASAGSAILGYFLMAFFMPRERT